MDRNDVGGFSQRVITNLKHTTIAFAKGDDVHLVTALISSLLGIIVFPVEFFKQNSVLKNPNTPFSNNRNDGSFIWNFTLGTSTNLNDHLFHIRNYLAHRRILFSSNSRYLNEVVVYFSDRKPWGKEDYWKCHVSASDLYDFTIRLPDFIKYDYDFKYEL